MGGALAARMGDEIGGHGNGWAGLIAGAALGAVVGAALVLAAPATLLAVAVASLVAVGTTTGLASVGARLGKLHASGASCGVILTGASRTYIENSRAARANEDVGAHQHQAVAQGSATVKVEGAYLARVGDKVKCQGTILHGCKRTTIGGKASAAPALEDGPSDKVLHALDVTSGVAFGGAAVLGGVAAVAGFAVMGYGVMPRVNRFVADHFGEETALWLDGLMMVGGAPLAARAGVRSGAPREAPPVVEEPGLGKPAPPSPEEGRGAIPENWDDDGATPEMPESGNEIPEDWYKPAPADAAAPPAPDECPSCRSLRLPNLGTMRVGPNVVRTVAKGEKVGALVAELVSLTKATGNEHALFSMRSGERLIIEGGPTDVPLPGDARRIIAHTHPSGTPFASIGDRQALRALGKTENGGQQHSYILPVTEDGAPHVRFDKASEYFDTPEGPRPVSEWGSYLESLGWDEPPALHDPRDWDIREVLRARREGRWSPTEGILDEPECKTCKGGKIDVQAAFEIAKATPLPPPRVGDGGCGIRMIEWNKALQANGFKPVTVAIVTVDATNPVRDDGGGTWKFHTAPAVGSTDTGFTVIDPEWYPRPVSLEEWSSRLGGEPVVMPFIERWSPTDGNYLSAIHTDWMWNRGAWDR